MVAYTSVRFTGRLRSASQSLDSATYIIDDDNSHRDMATRHSNVLDGLYLLADLCIAQIAGRSG